MLENRRRRVCPHADPRPPRGAQRVQRALYDATARGLRDAAADPDVSVVVITGAGRAFSAGTDLMEMQARVSDPDFVPGEFGFPGLVDALAEFPKPLIVAINGIGLGIGATIIGFADLVFMSSQARLKCPFTALGVAPEASSSFFMPALIGRQNATWMLMSSGGSTPRRRSGWAWSSTSASLTN